MSLILVNGIHPSLQVGNMKLIALIILLFHTLSRSEKSVDTSSSLALFFPLALIQTSLTILIWLPSPFFVSPVGTLKQRYANICIGQVANILDSLGYGSESPVVV